MDLLSETGYSKEKFISLLNNGVCPVCNKNGFKKVLIHIQHAHGVNQVEVKDMLFISRSKSFCDLTTKQLHREIAISRGMGKTVKAKSSTKGRKLDGITMKKRESYFKIDQVKESIKKERKGRFADCTYKQKHNERFIKLVGSEEAIEKRNNSLRYKTDNDNEFREKITRNIQKANSEYRKRVGEVAYRTIKTTKVPVYEYEKIKERFKNGESQPQIAKGYNCSQALISSIVTGKRKPL